MFRMAWLKTLFQWPNQIETGTSGIVKTLSFPIKFISVYSVHITNYDSANNIALNVISCTNMTTTNFSFKMHDVNSNRPVKGKPFAIGKA